MDKAESKGIRVALTVTAVLSLLVILGLSAVVIFKDQGIFLILFALFYVLVPGFAFLITLDHDIFDRFRSWTLILSFFAGFSLIVIQYYLLNAFGILEAVRFTPLITGLVLIFISRKRIKAAKEKLPSYKEFYKAGPFLALTAVVMIAGFYGFYKTVPDRSSNVFLDYCYHMGNIDILYRGGSLEDTRVMGMTFKYHYFMDLFNAVLKYVFPADIWNMVLRYPVLLVPPLVSGSVYNLIQRKTNNRAITFVVSFLALIFPSVTATTALLPNHIITNVNSVGVALPLVIVLVEIFLRSAVPSEGKYSDLILVFLLGFTLTGLKGPFALALAGVIVVFFIYSWIINRKATLLQVLMIPVFIASFAVIWFSLLSVAATGSNVTGEAHGIMKYLSLQVTVPGFGLTDGFLINTSDAIMFIPQSLFFTFAGASVPFIIMLFVVIARLFMKKQSEPDLRTAMCVICSCAGIFMNYLMAVGYNRNYFFMFAMPFVYYSAAAFICHVLRMKRKMLRLLSLVLTALCCMISVLAIYNNCSKPFLAFGSGKLSQDEIGCVEWIRENTDRDALFAINESEPNGKKYYYSGFSERKFYLETYKYAENSGKTAEDLAPQIEMNARLYTDESSPELAEKIGIDYLIYYNGTGDETVILDKYYQLCYDSPEVRVYSVRQQ